jgi:NAD(P)H-flavin reductase
MAEWGTIPRIKLERKLYEWCQDNRQVSGDLISLLNPLDGPSYAFLTQGEDCRQHFQHLRLTTIKNVEVCRDHKLMQMQLPDVKLNIVPGQFFHIICDPIKKNEHSIPLTLRRPFSIHGAQYERFDRSFLARAGEMPTEIKDILERWPSRVDFLYKIVGVGTQSLSKIPEGTVIDAIGPCGNGFDIKRESTTSKAIIVAGGIGVAPLIALVERLRYLDKEVYVYLGALSKEILTLAIKRPDSDVELSFADGNREFVETIRQDFREIGVNNLYVCTDDGSVGHKGLVTEKLNRDLSVGSLPWTDV